MGSEPCGIPMAPVASPWVLWHRWLCTGPKAPLGPSFCIWMSDSTRLTGTHPATCRWANTVAPMTKLAQHSELPFYPRPPLSLLVPRPGLAQVHPGPRISCRQIWEWEGRCLESPKYPWLFSTRHESM